MYGKVLVDYYGNPQNTSCGNCRGNGQVVFYQSQLTHIAAALGANLKDS